MKQFIITIACLGVCSLLFFNGCHTGGEDGEDNPIPVLSSISPSTAVSHMPPFTLTAHGANFVPGSTILFNGVVKETTFVSDGELTCRIDPDDTLESPAASINPETVRQGKVKTAPAGWNAPVLVRSPPPFTYPLAETIPLTIP